MKKFILIIFLSSISFFCFAEDNSFSLAQQKECPIKFTIETDKEKYFVGDTIKIIYTIINISDEPVAFYRSFYKSFRPLVEVLENKICQYFNDDSPYCYEADSTAYIVLQQGEIFRDEEQLARVSVGKVYNYITPFEKKLYYDGFYLLFLGMYKEKNHLLVKNGFGKYKISSKFCSEKPIDTPKTGRWVENIQGGFYFDYKITPLENCWYSCVDSNEVEVQIEENK